MPSSKCLDEEHDVEGGIESDQRHQSDFVGSPPVPYSSRTTPPREHDDRAGGTNGGQPEQQEVLRREAKEGETGNGKAEPRDLVTANRRNPRSANATASDDILMHAPEEDDSGLPLQPTQPRSVAAVGAYRVWRHEGGGRVHLHAPEQDYSDIVSFQQDDEMVEGEAISEAHVIEYANTQDSHKQRRNCILINSLVGIVVFIVGVVLGIRLGRRNGEVTGTTPPSSPPTLSPSLIPSQKPTLTLVSRIQSYSPWTTFEDPSSGQSRALDWISTDERSLGLESDALFLQRFALAVLHFATNGEVWGLLSGPDDFLSENGECTGRDGEQGGPPNLSCDFDGFVTKIDLNNRNLLLPADYLWGTFPPEMALLTRLTSFQAANNDWTGTLPTQLGLMTALQILDLSSLEEPLDGMVGLLPTEIGNLGNLNTLSLQVGRFQLPIPSELWQLTKLTHLALGTTSASPFPSEVGLLSALTALSMTNGLSGVIPTELGQLSQVSAVDVMWNISGTLPSEIGRLTELHSFSTRSSPNLVGSIPSEFGRLTKLQEFYVGETSLSGKLPSEIGMMTSLTACGLRVSGELPSEIGLLTKLSFALLDQGSTAQGTTTLSQLPSEVGLLSDLQLLEISGVLSGTIPSEMGMTEALRILSLQQNHLVGPIPSELFTLSNLHAITLSENDLQSSIPSEIELWSNVGAFLSLEGCKLTGTIPTEVSSLTSLTTLRLANNPSLTGQLPTMSGLRLLQEISLHNTGLDDMIDCSDFSSFVLQMSLDVRNLASSDVDKCIEELSTTDYCYMRCESL